MAEVSPAEVTPPRQSLPGAGSRSARRLSSFHSVRKLTRPGLTPIQRESFGLTPRVPRLTSHDDSFPERPALIPGVLDSDAQRRRVSIAPTPGRAPVRAPGRTPGRRSVSRHVPPDAAAHGSAPPTRMTDAELADMYSKTIKLCQDNKINTKNTWSLNLIDYMGMLVKDGAAESVHGDASGPDSTANGQTNFQVAGVTLDAGVRIYCSRVDSVHTNAFKVLGALSRSANPGADDAAADDENGDELAGDEESENSKRRRRRGNHRSGGNTLETNIDNITVKKLETDLVVDPLFQKMSAAFDEGGAKGMLLNILCVGPRCEIVFDSNEPAQPQLQQLDTSTMTNPAGEETDESDLNDLTTSDASVYDVSDALPTAGGESDKPLTLCPRFLAFYNARKGISSGREPEAPRHGICSASAEALADASHDFTFEYSPDDAMPGESLVSGELPVSLPRTSLETDAPIQGGVEDEDDVSVFHDGRGSLDSTTHELGGNPQLLSTGIDLVEAGMALDRNSEYSFFDSNALESWAGPQHWRFRATSADPRADASAAMPGKASKRSKGKTALLLDFSAEAPSIDFEAEFARPKKPSTCQLSRTVQDSFSEKKVTLPEDLHFNTQTLATLFLKPKVAVVAKRQRRLSGVEPGVGASNDISAQGWYDFENEGDDNFCPPENDEDPSAVFDFDADHASRENAAQGAIDDELVPEPARVEKIDIAFATVAKRVDVRQLKSGMWTHLRAGAAEDEGEADGKVSESDAEASTPSTPEAKKENWGAEESQDIRAGSTKTLQGLVRDMPAYVPESSLADVSLSYIFICLLHLANEKTLSISPLEGGSLDDLTIQSSTPATSSSSGQR